MRVWIQNLVPESLVHPDGPTSMWLMQHNTGDPEYDAFVASLPAKNFIPPVPTVVDPLSYVIKLQQKFGAGLIQYLIGTYYGPGQETFETARRYVDYKYSFYTNLPPQATKVIWCDDSTNPVYDPWLTDWYDDTRHYYLGYWLASDPNNFVPVFVSGS